jgi:hypothetical protein
MNAGRVAPAGGGEPDDGSTVTVPTITDSLIHGTAAERASRGRAIAAGKPWFSHLQCKICAGALERAG